MVGTGRRWGREAAAIAALVVLSVLLAFLPDYRGWVLVLAIVGVALVTGLARWLDHDDRPELPSIPPTPRPGLPPPPEIFVGEAQLRTAEKLSQRLLEPGVVAVSGESGLGKTTLVSAAINSPPLRRTGRGRIWLSAVGIATRSEAEVLVADALGAESLTAGLAAFTGQGPLVVVDDVELLLRSNPTDARHFVNQLCEATRERGTFVLIAQGHPDWPEDVATLVEPPLLDEQGADELFARWAPGSAADPRRGELLDYVGGAPRAVELLAKTAAQCDLGDLVEHINVNLLTVGPGLTRHVSLSIAVDLVLQSKAVTEEHLALLQLVNLFPAGITIEDGPTLFPDKPLQTLQLRLLYALGLIRNTGAGAQVATVVGHRLEETRPPLREPEPIWSRFVQLAIGRVEAGGDEARSWLDSNQLNIDHACRCGWPGVPDLARALFASDRYLSASTLDVMAEIGTADMARKFQASVKLDRSLPWRRARDLLRTAAMIYRRSGALVEQADTLRDLGQLALERDHLDDSARYLGEAVAVYRQLALASLRDSPDRGREADVLETLGHVEVRRGEGALAEAHLKAALAIYRQISDPSGEAKALRDLGELARLTNRYDQAEQHFQDALALHREHADRIGEADTAMVLGRLARQRDQPDVADRRLREALALFRELSASGGEAYTLLELGALGVARHNSGEAGAHLQRAEADLRQALDIHVGRGDRHGRAMALHELGRVARAGGRSAEAVEHLTSAIELHRLGPDPLGTANSLLELGRCLLASEIGRRREAKPSAEECFREARDLFRSIDSLAGEGNALFELGVSARRRGRPAEAEQHFLEAMTVYGRIPDPNGVERVTNERRGLDG